ncbi:hypothetical protein EMIHUDRAFT_73387 [Emiliania huxleyi CCMP1516]|uniref:Carboxypeptidase n=2 Tax=Emiliania huxleyi TaxID=2903 RepID=A0A0D3JUV8_EMIH1|nr:hypothetical protein EMIHUDRAFT_73387 [Emiliania huxleyi CCMP1516]EOD27293.1 hypothetical protein EMIHUDRAFT_73387 [Emiliania huxleyi CCMP1516]|eukprot:XP_005779722.1 hypothetical protein EMIHUDRAFT_73387 [Emiliania huxleyi CCMP1516]
MSLLLLSVYGFSPAGDEVKALPGWYGALPSRQFSGYLSVGEHKKLHYWLVEAEARPESAPLVLWLNGGPGCSSLDGFIYEHGPFRTSPEDPTKLIRFEHAWSKVANMLYLEAPAGTHAHAALHLKGSSVEIARPCSDYRTDDDQTAADSASALQAFFEAFPRFRSASMFITGESYAGVYVPTLAEAVLALVDKGRWKGAALEGIAVGNGCSGTEVRAACDFGASEPSAPCSRLLDQMGEAVGHVNLYNVYGQCISSGGAVSNGAVGNSSADAVRLPSTQKIPYAGGGFLGGGSGKLFSGRTRLRGPDACIDSAAGSAYLNQPAVILAAHVVKQPIPWSTCGNQIRYTSTRKNLPRDTYPALVKRLRVLVYNGDWDACVPHTDAEAWTAGMGYAEAAPWHPWRYKNGTQVAGYATRYAANNFTFATVKGGRHEVPETAPEQALELLSRLVGGRQF